MGFVIDIVPDSLQLSAITYAVVVRFRLPEALARAPQQAVRVARSVTLECLRHHTSWSRNGRVWGMPDPDRSQLLSRAQDGGGAGAA
jgi:hypothetical protein